jgi:ferredoxin-type protein NapH
VLNLRKAAAAGMIASGECTNCGRCITICPEDSLHFDLRRLIAARAVKATTENPRRSVA